MTPFTPGRGYDASVLRHRASSVLHSPPMFSALLVTGELVVVVVVVAAYRAALSGELGLSSSVFARRPLAEDPRIDRATAIVNLPVHRHTSRALAVSSGEACWSDASIAGPLGPARSRSLEIRVTSPRHSIHRPFLSLVLLPPAPLGLPLSS